jgi:hypothetical protein
MLREVTAEGVEIPVCDEISNERQFIEIALAHLFSRFVPPLHATEILVEIRVTNDSARGKVDDLPVNYPGKVTVLESKTVLVGKEGAGFLSHELGLSPVPFSQLALRPYAGIKKVHVDMIRIDVDSDHVSVFVDSLQMKELLRQFQKALILARKILGCDAECEATVDPRGFDPRSGSKAVTFKLTGHAGEVISVEIPEGDARYRLVANDVAGKVLRRIVRAGQKSQSR